MSPAALKHLRTLYDNEVPPLLIHRQRALVQERAIAGHVHAAWGLDAADLALLRETAPPRMPPGF